MGNIVAPAQLQLDAYNNKDIELFLSAYTNDVEIYDHPHTLSLKGKEAMRERYSKLFATYPAMHCELVNRIISKKTVIDHERITGRGGDPIEAIAIYEIEDELISKVWFIRG